MRLKNTSRRRVDLFIIAGLILLGLVILRGFLRVGFPQTHDGDMHLARLANLNLAFHDHHFPFRWARNLNHEFGLPIFNFYYYLLELVAFIPMKLGFSIEHSLKLVTVLSYLGAAVVLFIWLKPKFGRFSAAAAGIFSLTAIYPLAVILIRGSLGESLAYFLLVLNFYLLERFIRRPGRLTYLLAVGGLAAFLLSHNITVVFGLPLLALFAFLKGRFRAGLVFITSIGLSLFFWLPLLLERQFTYFNSIVDASELFKHFPTLTQLIYMPWGFGISAPGTADTMSFTLGPIHWLIILLAFIGAKKGFFHWAFIGFVFLALPISAWFWRLFPVLSFVQFPWRLVLFLALLGSYLAAVAAKAYRKLTAVLLAGAIIFTVVTVYDQGHFNWPDAFYFHYPFTTTTQLEAMPRWFDAAKNAQLFGKPDKVFSLTGQAVNQEQVVWKTQRHSYQVTLIDNDQLFERTAYFPGWAVTVDGQPQEIIKDNQTYPGLIGYNVPAGSHQIVTTFSDSTPARQWGDKLSLLSLGVLIFSFLSFPKSKVK
ncbi:MAG: hypothetical protein U1C50_01630 [Patescibacteria group bacterium]|nr:hypothetical protein [Patescibacteria group bacterium]